MSTLKVFDLVSAADLTDATERQMLADALDDEGRQDEAWLLRAPKAQLLVDRGEVRRFTGRDVLLALEHGDVIVDVISDEDVAPLTDARSAEAYPTCTIEVLVGATARYQWRGVVQGWKCVLWAHGPNHSLNGSYIGEGWQELIEDSDGQFSGRPDETGMIDSQTIEIDGGANLDSVLRIPADGLMLEERTQVAEALFGMVSEAYDNWTPATASYEEIAEALTSNPRHEVDHVSAPLAPSEDEDEPGEERVGIFAGEHLGAPVWAIEGDATLYFSLADARAAARKALAEAIEGRDLRPLDD